MYKVYIVSDGTGRTAEQAVNAALVQFPNAKIEIIRKAKVRSEKKITEIVKEVSDTKGFIVHTLVKDKLRNFLIREGREHNISTIDIMGPLLSRLTEQIASSPVEKWGLFVELNKDYFRRIEAMKFAIDHDDGARVEDLKKAEIILLGVSRTFKTPLSIYLAFKGWYTANIPILLGDGLPDILKKLPDANIYCLDTNPRQLTELRRARNDYLDKKLDDYIDAEYVRIELMHARKLYSQNPKWSIINVTTKPIEEIASEILAVRSSKTKSLNKKRTD